MLELQILRNKKQQCLKISIINSENGIGLANMWSISKIHDNWVEVIKRIWKSKNEALLHMDCPILGKLANIRIDHEDDGIIKNLEFGNGVVSTE